MKWLMYLCLILSILAYPTHEVNARLAHAIEGVEWTSFSKADGLAGDSILALNTQPNGTLWIGTSSGLSLRTVGGDWLTLTSGDGLNSDIVTDIANDATIPQRHWIATDDGATVLDDGGKPLDKSAYTWANFGQSDGLYNTALSAVAVAADGRIWFGTDSLDANGNETGYGVSVLNTNGTPFTKTDDIWTAYFAGTGSLSNNVIHDIAVDAHGTVWVATYSGLNAFSNGIWTSFFTGNGLPSNNVAALLVVGDVVWIATSGGIAALSDGNTPLDKSDDHWASFTTYNSGLIDNRVKVLAADASGRIWVGTDWLAQGGDVGAGVSVLDAAGTPFNPADDVWSRFTTASGLPSNAIRALAVSGSGTSWFGTKYGLSQLNFGSSLSNQADDAWTTVTERSRLAGATVRAIADIGGQGIWLGTESGLSYLDYNFSPNAKRDDRWTTYTTSEGLPSDSIRALAVDGKGRLWIGTLAGLVVRDTRGTPTNPYDDISVQYDSTTGLAHNQINDIVFDSAGRAWIACGSYFAGGLNVLDIGASVITRSDDVWASFTVDNTGGKLPDSYVRAVALQNNTKAWLATPAGLAQLNYAGSPFNKADDSWTTFTVSNTTGGLAYDGVRDVAVDAAGNIWAGLASQGVSVLSTSGGWVNFRQADGLANESINVLHIDRMSNIWIGTDGGGVSALSEKNTLADKSDDIWTTYAAPDTLLSGNVYAFAQDRWGQFWVGTFGGGASVQSSVQFRRTLLPIIRR